MKSVKSDQIQPVAGDDVIQTATENISDPYAQLEDLMSVVEELCPEWPKRKTFKDSDTFLL